MDSAMVHDALRCSFCHKGQKAARKLISSPSDYPRAYICDECISICVAILEDDQEGPAAPEPDEVPVEGQDEGPHPLLSHPLASELMTHLMEWIRQDSLGHSGIEALARLRSTAARMLAS